MDSKVLTNTSPETNDTVATVYPRIEQFIESRESYIKALEKTIELLERENKRQTKVHRKFNTQLMIC